MVWVDEKNRENRKIDFFRFSCPRPAPLAPQNFLRWSEHSKYVFWAFFFWFWRHFDAKIMIFDVFLMFFWWFSPPPKLFDGARRLCTGVKESKKIEIAKNRFKHPQTIIECQLGGSEHRYSGLRPHMGQSIFADFRGSGRGGTPPVSGS